MSLWFVLTPMRSANQVPKDEIIKEIHQQRVMNLYFQEWLEKSKQQTDSMIRNLKFIPKYQVKAVKKIHKLLKEIPTESKGIPDSNLTVIPLEIIADTVEVPILKKVRIPFYKRIFKRKNKN